MIITDEKQVDAQRYVI